METSYEIAVDRRRSMLRIRLAGFFQIEDVARFAERKRAAHGDLRSPPNMHTTLVDIAECKIQPQQVVGAFAALIGETRYRARRTAFVTGSSLATMQVRRMIGGQPDMRLFTDMAIAEAWLQDQAARAA
jgi:hypothetical protein